MSKQVVAVGAAALTLAATAVVVDESPGGHGATPPKPGQIAPVRTESLSTTCPRRTPGHIPTNSWTPARHELAPPGATTIRLCRYSGLDALPRLALLRSVTIRARGLVRELVHELDALPVIRGAVACSLDDGSEIVALLAYPSHHVVMISVGLRGCELVTNGSVYRTAAVIGSSPMPMPRPQLVSQLERLTAGAPAASQHRAHS